MRKSNYTQTAMDFATMVLAHIVSLLARVSPLRHAAIGIGEKYIRLTHHGADRNFRLPPGVVADRAEFGKAIMHTADRALASGLSPAVIRRLIDNMVQGIMIEGGDQSAIHRFFEAQGTYPPGFMTISPTVYWLLCQRWTDWREVKLGYFRSHHHRS